MTRVTTGRRRVIGKWSGAPLRTFLQTALHPQTLMAFRLSDEILPIKHGFPFKLRIPTKLGFKNPKFVTALYATDQQPRGYWTDRGYNWFSGV
jgi:DMSO/TMAO reductase YedYZ molybdopterin-dependent catalytic subunit